MFLPGGRGGKKVLKERIRMNYDGKEKVFILFDFEKKIVLEAIYEIRRLAKMN